MAHTERVRHSRSPMSAKVAEGATTALSRAALLSHPPRICSDTKTEK